MKIVSDPQRKLIVYNLWSNGERVAQNIPSKELAAIFAAAPDMFEALEGLLANAPAPKNVKQDYSYILCREMARAALAKARGET